MTAGEPGRLDFGQVGLVTVATGKVEYGQGVWTALAQIASEELDVRLERVRIAPVATDTSPDEGVTSGSMSIEAAGTALRQACARARHALLVTAAARLGLEAGAAGALRVRDGEAIAASGGTGFTYWTPAVTAEAAPGEVARGEAVRGGAARGEAAPGEVARGEVARGEAAPGAVARGGAARGEAAQGEAALDDAPAPKPPGQWTVAGRSAPRIDLPDKVTGHPRFLHDLVLPGMLAGRVIHPPAPAAELQEVPRASLPPGVVDIVVDGSFLGVVAETDAAASAAARQLARAARWKVRESLPDCGDLKGFLLAAPAETSVIARRHDPQAAERVNITREAEYTRPFIAHASMAPSCAIAQTGAGALTVWTHSQGIFALRRALATGLGLSREDVIVRYAEGAGAYGHNGADDAALDAVLLARSPACRGRPVRVLWSRADELSWAPFGPAMLARLSAGLGPDGRILSWRHDVWSNGFLGRPGTGGEPRLLGLTHLAGGQPMTPATDGPPSPTIGAARNSVPGYDIPDLEVIRHRLLAMPVRTSALRSLGAFLNVFAIESFMDELAAAAGRDPVAFRIAHLSDPRARRVIERAAAMAGWSGDVGNEATGLGFARYKGTSGYCAAVAQVEAGTEIRLRRLWLAVDVGRVINPDGVRNQVEGGAVQSASWALRERVTFDRTRITSTTWDNYPILRFTDVPEVTVSIIDAPGEPETGAGEIAQGPVAGAIGNAVASATGVRVRDLPLTRDQIIRAIERS